MEVSGEIGIFEGQRACAPLQKHILGWRRYAQWIWVVAILAIDSLCQWLVDLVFPGWGVVGFLVGVVVGFVLMLRSIRRMAPRAWMRRGVPENSPVTYRIASDALVIDAAHSQTRLKWSGLSEIIPGNDAWLLVGQATAYFIPRRFFSQPGSEAAFLSACLEHMTAEARHRSVRATQSASFA